MHIDRVDGSHSVDIAAPRQHDRNIRRSLVAVGNIALHAEFHGFGAADVQAVFRQRRADGSKLSAVPITQRDLQIAPESLGERDRAAGKVFDIIALPERSVRAAGSRNRDLPVIQAHLSQAGTAIAAQPDKLGTAGDIQLCKPRIFQIKVHKLAVVR